LETALILWAIEGWKNIELLGHQTDRILKIILAGQRPLSLLLKKDFTLHLPIRRLRAG
jgi:hypothetical protein